MLWMQIVIPALVLMMIGLMLISYYAGTRAGGQAMKLRWERSDLNLIDVLQGWVESDHLDEVQRQRLADHTKSILRVMMESEKHHNYGTTLES